MSTATRISVTVTALVFSLLVGMLPASFATATNTAPVASHCQDCTSAADSIDDCCLQIHNCSGCTNLGKTPHTAFLGNTQSAIHAQQSNVLSIHYKPHTPPPKI